ncbi:LOW QUALITY PROTEIN: Gag-pol Polyprotein [Phytophthora palmivora]|uniref:Gag-pol Polyprotein n=1 Tax=Phytophthora palmivora TaxID=4796 RepID=A0A2P4XND8_9STRA|nr:LOW QUALITY PROTEIN: Gag-pol Polyprotein [Phytophthora palmivora]
MESISGRPTPQLRKLSHLAACSVSRTAALTTFVTAFLNGPTGEADIYMEQPEYFDDGSGRVCKLQQSLYGLWQAPRI